MPRFSDYHRTVIGYHGTDRRTAEKIVLRQASFQWYDRPGDWMGNGVYYWEYGPKQAWWWAELRRRQRKWTEPIAVVASMIRLGFCFDLLDPDNARDLKSFYHDYVETQTALRLPVPTNQRRHKNLDKAIFEYAYAAIEQEDEKSGEKDKVDTCRGVYVRPGHAGRLWNSSWVEHGTFIQLLVRNPDCILGSWLVKPIEGDDYGETAEASDSLVDANQPGREGIPQDVDPGSGSDHGQGWPVDPGPG